MSDHRILNPYRKYRMGFILLFWVEGGHSDLAENALLWTTHISTG
jgi:hypothetical protein